MKQYKLNKLNRSKKKSKKKKKKHPPPVSQRQHTTFQPLTPVVHSLQDRTSGSKIPLFAFLFSPKKKRSVCLDELSLWCLVTLTTIVDRDGRDSLPPPTHPPTAPPGFAVKKDAAVLLFENLVCITIL